MPSTDQRAPASLQPAGVRDTGTVAVGQSSVHNCPTAPSIPDAVQGVRDLAAETEIEVRAVKLESSQQVRDSAPSAYGVFNVVYNGEFVTYHYIDSKKRKRAFLTRLSKAGE